MRMINKRRPNTRGVLIERVKVRASFIDTLQAGLAQNAVVRHFGCHRNTILSLWRRFRQAGNTRNHRRSGRPRVTSRRQYNHIRLVHLRNRFQTSSDSVLCQSSLERINSTKTLIFVETWYNTGVNVIQTKLFFWCVGANTNLSKPQTVTNR
jgi:hypothetical protein